MRSESSRPRDRRPNQITGRGIPLGSRFARESGAARKRGRQGLGPNHLTIADRPPTYRAGFAFHASAGRLSQIYVQLLGLWELPQ